MAQQQQQHGTQHENEQLLAYQRKYDEELESFKKLAAKLHQQAGRINLHSSQSPKQVGRRSLDCLCVPLHSCQRADNTPPTAAASKRPGSAGSSRAAG